MLQFGFFASEMTYIVSGGAINSTHSLTWGVFSLVNLPELPVFQFCRSIAARPAGLAAAGPVFGRIYKVFPNPIIFHLRTKQLG